MKEQTSIKICIIALLIYVLCMMFDIFVTLTVQQRYPLLFSQIELSPITSFFMENFYLPFNLLIPFIIILLFFILTKNRFEGYNKDKKIYYVTGILCYTIAMAVIHLVGASGAFIHGWL